MSSSLSTSRSEVSQTSRDPRVVSIGEAMVMLTPDDGQAVERADVLRQSVGGAEANVARVVSSLGVTSQFVSRTGDDPFGRRVAADLRESSVDTALMAIDPDRPTGLYLKAPGAAGSRMFYYRSGSAATAMNAAYFAAPRVRAALGAASVVHTSGITAAVLAESAGLIEALASARESGALVSVDVNFRPTLWRGRALTPLFDLLAVADLVLVGADEARAVFDTDELDRLRDRLNTSATIVVKSDAQAVTASLPDGETVVVPALGVDVVEPVGAGDAFAGGLLSGLALGLPLASSLRLGHICAAGVLVTVRDQAPPPTVSIRERLLAADAGEWASVRVRATGFAAAFLLDEASDGAATGELSAGVAAVQP